MIFSRCICPGNTATANCKILARKFQPVTSKSKRSSEMTNHYLLPALPTCSKVHVFFYFMSNGKNQGLLYVEGNHNNSHQYLGIFTSKSHVKLYIKGRKNSQPLRIHLNKEVDDNLWHRIDLFWENEVSVHLGKVVFIDRLATLQDSAYILDNDFIVQWHS